MIIAVWAFNIFGIRPFKGFTYVTAGLLTVALVGLIILPFVTGHWHASNVHATFTGPWGGTKQAFVYLFILAWSAWAAEVCATFAPEYKTRQDAEIALRSFGGVRGRRVHPAAVRARRRDRHRCRRRPPTGQFYSAAFEKIAGNTVGTFFLICLLASLILSMSSSTADGGRALYGISKAGMTIKQLGVLNRYHVPGRAMTVDLVVNCLLVLFISSNLAILYMSNIGYVLAHLFAVSGFLLLRKDRPHWPRPVKLSNLWVGIAGFMTLLVAFLLVVGALAPHLNGYGTWTDFGIGVGVLFASVLLFIFRRVVQDHEHVHFREEVPGTPEEEAEIAARTTPPAAVTV